MARRKAAAAPAPVRPVLKAVPGTGGAWARDRSRAEVIAAVAGMPVEFLQCRDYGHVWQDRGARWYPSLHYWEQMLKCTRCKLQRARHMTARGALIDAPYDYPEGYLMPAGVGRLTSVDRDAIRLATVTWSAEHLVEEEQA